MGTGGRAERQWCRLTIPMTHSFENMNYNSDNHKFEGPQV